MNKKLQKKVLTLLFVFFLLIGFSIAFVTYKPQISNSTAPTITIIPTQTITDNPYEASLEGEVVCLPHWDTSGPQTLECAFGLKTNDGTYYALSAGETSVPPYQTGQRIRVKGTVTPKEMLSAAHWEKYDIRGIFSIKGSIEVL
jgi:hypothetical protein